MAIKLEVEEYCQNCNQFQVDIQQYKKGSSNNIDTHIFCKHKDTCKSICEYLDQRYRNIFDIGII